MRGDTTAGLRQGALVVLAVVLLAPSPAEAYLDPGSGSLVFQAALAALATVAYFARRWLAHLGGLLHRKRPGAGGPAHPVSDVDDRDGPGQ